MKPTQLKHMPTKNAYRVSSIQPQVATIKGTVELDSKNYSKSYLILYNSTDYLPIQFVCPDVNGNYIFKDLNTELNTYIVAFDKDKKMNAVIQDNVVPK